MKPVLRLSAWLLLGALCGCGDSEPAADPGEQAIAAPAPRPHVLLISVDTLRPDHLAVYGYERETAPTLSALATQGVVYENAYSPASATVASHATMFTGRIPSQHRTFNFRDKLPQDEVTLSDLFGEIGYGTRGVASSVRFHDGSGFDQGFEVFERFHKLEKNDRSEAVTDQVLEWMTGADPAEQPLFVFAHYFGPHEPYAPPEPFRSRWHPGLESPTPESSSRYVQFHAKPGQDVPPETLEYLEALYDGEILYLDGQLQRLFDGLDAAGLADDTLVILTSDHGEGFKDNGRMSHSYVLNEELVRIPLILRWPGHLPAGARFEAPVGLTDLLPTILDLLELPVPGQLAGRSRKAEMAGTEVRRRGLPEIVIAQGSDEFWSVTANLRTGRFKLVRNVDGTRELYHLDPHTFGGPDVIADHELEEQQMLHIASQIEALKASNARQEAADVPEEVRQQLKEIGYTGELQGG